MPRRKRVKLGDEVTGYLREALVSGVFHPGQRLNIEDLAQQLEVSAMPVREALVALANEGLIDVLPNRGFRAVAVTRQDIRDVFTLTAFTGGMLAERAASTITPDQLAVLREVQTQIERAAKMRDGRRRFKTIEALNRRFHETVISNTEGRRLQWFYRAAVRVTPRFESEEEWVAAQVEDHPGILHALEARNGRLARQLAEAHSSRVATVVLAHLEAGGFWEGGDEPKGIISLPPESLSPADLLDKIFD